MRGWMAMGLTVAMAVAAAGATGPAAAQEACAVPPGLANFTRPLAMPRGAAPALPVGRAVTVPLAVGAKLAVAPDKPAAEGTRAGVFGFTVAKAGRYRVAVDQPLWIEVASRGARQASVAHGHAPACSGARKTVDFDLQPGFHVLQLSNAAKPEAVVVVAAL